MNLGLGNILRIEQFLWGRHGFDGNDEGVGRYGVLWLAVYETRKPKRRG
jgi:hypothetical protein